MKSLFLYSDKNIIGTSTPENCVGWYRKSSEI